MRRCFVLLVLLSSIAMPLSSVAEEKHVDYNYSDGSRTRVTYATDNSGNTSVTSTHMTKADVEKENMGKAALELVGWFIKALVWCASSSSK